MEKLAKEHLVVLKGAVDFLHAGISPDKNHRRVLAEAINAALVVLESGESFTAKPDSGDKVGYKRRPCSKCGEGLGFTESDPCDACSCNDPPSSADGLIERRSLTDAADAFVIAKGNRYVELNGNILRHWMAEFAAQAIAADRTRVIDEFVDRVLKHPLENYNEWAELLRRVAEGMKRK